jgi:ATP phosphoribosyltransferase regulatory subunit
MIALMRTPDNSAGAPAQAPMTPSGTRDFLPQEMAELKALMDAFRRCCDRRGYSEVHTPALEYERALESGHLEETDPAYRLLDTNGDRLVLRSDLTLPIARLASRRYESEDLPLRFYYVAYIYRAVQLRRAQRREILHCGVELLGEPGPQATVEVARLLVEVLDQVGLNDCRLVLGDVRSYPEALHEGGVPEDRRAALLAHLEAGDLVALERAIERLEDLEPSVAQRLAEIPRIRGGASVLADPRLFETPAIDRLRALDAALPPTIRSRTIYDLGETQRLGYYTGPVFDVLDPQTSYRIAVGGHYDKLLEDLGFESVPSVGFAIDLELAHRGTLARALGPT